MDIWFHFGLLEIKMIDLTEEIKKIYIKILIYFQTFFKSKCICQNCCFEYNNLDKCSIWIIFDNNPLNINPINMPTKLDMIEKRL